MVWNVLLLKHPASDVPQSGAAHDAFDGQANQTKIFFEPRRQAPFERVSGGELALQELCTGGLWIGGGTAAKQLSGLQSALSLIHI